MTKLQTKHINKDKQQTDAEEPEVDPTDMGF